MNDFRIGIGYDSHRFTENFPNCKPFLLGGVAIPFHQHCIAHSDGDVLYHALADALLGALALPDIGQCFPNTASHTHNMDSAIIVKHVHQEIANRGYFVNNVDITIILERPKLALFTPSMKKNIASLLHITEDRVSVKAKTNEQLDAIGAGLGVAVQAAVSLIKE